MRKLTRQHTGRLLGLGSTWGRDTSAVGNCSGMALRCWFLDLGSGGGEICKCWWEQSGRIWGFVGLGLLVLALALVNVDC